MPLNKKDTRPAVVGWAPGGYVRQCRTCLDTFEGDKRATSCAPCAYGDDAANTLRQPCIDTANRVPGNDLDSSELEWVAHFTKATGYGVKELRELKERCHARAANAGRDRSEKAGKLGLAIEALEEALFQLGKI